MISKTIFPYLPLYPNILKALSDLKKDQVLQQYQFFVGDDAFASTEKLKQVREEENFWL